MKLEMNNKLIKKIILAVMGSILLGFGIGMNIKVGIGVDSLSAVYTACSRIFNLSVGTITAIANVIILVFAWFLYKKNVGISTVIFIIVSKWPIDFANKYFINSNNFIISILLCLVSIVVIALGCELQILSDLGANAYDAMVMGVGKRLNHKVKFVYLRWFFDGLFLVIAIILKGEIGIGTVLSFALIGSFIKMWQAILEKRINK